MTSYLLMAFLGAGIANFAFSIVILRELAAANIKVSFYEMRWQMYKHLKTYRELTRARSGKVAFPYYGYLVTLGLMIGSGVLWLASILE